MSILIYRKKSKSGVNKISYKSSGQRQDGQTSEVI